MEIVAVPEERIGVVIGKDGSQKEEIEKRFSVKLKIEGNQVYIKGDSLNILKARDVVLAMGRGFSPSRAMLLENDQFIFKEISLSEFSEKERVRFRARIIGSSGAAREQLQSMTGAEISVYGKTVSLIGRPSDVSIAKEAISLLLEGASHGAVYKFISRKRRDSWQKQ